MFLAVVLLLITAVIIWWFHKTRNYPPGPWGLPILGYLLFLDPKAPYKSLQQLSKKYGSTYCITLGTVNTVVLSETSVIREFLRREEFTARAPLYLTHGIMGGQGLICAEGALWKDQRRQTIDWLKRMGMVKFGSSRAILEKRIRTGVEDFLKMVQEASSERVDINPMRPLHHTMGNIVNDLVFGITYGKNDVTWLYLQVLQEEGVKYIGVSGVVNFLPFLRFMPLNQNTINFLLQGKRKTHKIYDRIIDACRKRLETSTATEGHDENNDERLSILECFLREKQKRMMAGDPSVEMYNDDQLRHLLADLFGGGVDTTLTTLRWLLLYLATYRKYQDMLRMELSGLDRNALCMDDLENIDLLKACVSEAQRIRSVVPLGMPHGTVKDTMINGYKIPKNTMIIPLLWAVHMNPDLWPNPEEFNPLRFITPEGKYFCPPQFIPFQSGKRMCPGEELAKMMLYHYVGAALKNFDIFLSPTQEFDMEGECGITLTPPHYFLVFKPIPE